MLVDVVAGDGRIELDVELMVDVFGEDVVVGSVLEQPVHSSATARTTTRRTVSTTRCRAAQDSQRTMHLDLLEAVRERRLHHVPGRLATVGRVGEDVVHEQQSAGDEVLRERAVVVLRGLFGVVAVEEEHFERCRPPGADHPGVGDDGTQHVGVLVEHRAEGGESVKASGSFVTIDSSCHSQPGWFSSDPWW